MWDLYNWSIHSMAADSWSGWIPDLLCNFGQELDVSGLYLGWLHFFHPTSWLPKWALASWLAVTKEARNLSLSLLQANLTSPCCWPWLHTCLMRLAQAHLWSIQGCAARMTKSSPIPSLFLASHLWLPSDWSSWPMEQCVQAWPWPLRVCVGVGSSTRQANWPWSSCKPCSRSRAKCPPLVEEQQGPDLPLLQPFAPCEWL